jgi:hypothetical protein
LNSTQEVTIGGYGCGLDFLLKTSVGIINCKFRSFHYSASSVARALHVLVCSFYWSKSTRSLKLFEFNINRTRNFSFSTCLDLIILTIMALAWTL